MTIPTAVTEWIAAHTPNPAAMDEAAAALLTSHTEWDSPLHFLHFLTIDGGELVPAAIVGVDTSIQPPTYPRVLLPMAAQAVAEHRTDNPDAAPVVAALLLFEAFHIQTGPDGPTAEERAALDNRKLHTLPQRIESARVIGADVGGRSVFIQKTRGTGGNPDHVAAVTTEGDGGFHDMMRRMALLIAAMNVAPQDILAGLVKKAREAGNQ